MKREKVRVFVIIAVAVAVIVFLLNVVKARAADAVGFDLKKSLGIAYTYDIDQNKSGGGLKFNPIKLFDGYVSAGLFAYDNTQLENWPLLGGNISLDIAKMIKKDKGILTNFDIGYFFTWTSLESFANNLFNPDYSGLLGTVVKFTF